MRGGAGNDTYVVSATGDIVTELANEGIDTVRSFVSTYVLGNTLENLVFATTVSSVATGNSLNNRLQGNIGNDTLDGRAGADWMAGGLGNDTYVVDEQLDEVVELAGGGTDTIRTTLTSQTLLANVEHLTYTGSANFTGVGNVLANTITAGSGSDTLDGGAGADRLVGGDGNDTYLVDSALDVVVETSSTGGIDLVRASSSSYSLSSNVENLTFVGTGSFSGAGNLSNNIIIGGDGADSLSGGAGNDRLSGGLGNDTYFVDVSTDVVVEAANSGVDTVTSSGTSFTLSENVENLIQTGTGSATLTGNGLDNYLLGNAGANVLRGLEGNDRLEGGKGDDRLEGNAGNDIFVFGTVGFGADTIAGGFDADAAGGQDLLDISGLGITAASFSSTVTFADLGSDLRVTVGSFGSFVLQGVGDPATVNIDDFLLSTGSPPVPGAGPGDIMSVG